MCLRRSAHALIRALDETDILHVCFQLCLYSGEAHSPSDGQERLGIRVRLGGGDNQVGPRVPCVQDGSREGPALPEDKGV